MQTTIKPFVYFSSKTTNFTTVELVICDVSVKSNVALITMCHLNMCEMCYVCNIIVVIVHVLVYLRPQIKFWGRVHTVLNVVYM